MARFATIEYKSPNFGNLDSYNQHLTNYAINKDHPLYQTNNEKGHKRKMTSVFDQMESEGVDT
jgi:hypothetical protein